MLYIAVVESKYKSQKLRSSANFYNFCKVSAVSNSIID